MTFLNSSGCTWINFSVCKWACGHLTLWSWENYAHLLWHYKPCTWWILYIVKTSKIQQAYLAPHFQVLPTRCGHFLETQSWKQVFLLVDMRSVMFSVKGGLFPHLHFVVVLENKRDYSWSNFVWGDGRVKDHLHPFSCQSWDVSLWLCGCDVFGGDGLLHLEG